MRTGALRSLTLTLAWLALTAQVPPPPPPLPPSAPPPPVPAGATAPGAPAARPPAPSGAAKAPGAAAPAPAAPAEPAKPFTYYRWVDADGVVHYTQLPPPPGIKETPMPSQAGVAPVRAPDEPPAKAPAPKKEPGKRAR